ncbi:psbP-like protein 1, chloroplastic isoform X2 [Medicago truncatula]|uniref:Oxygen-evolving complex/thylakoid lumenal 25.6 kDa protein n=1 Tax=Medicago truncatula TaxID=3880 RepID=I3S6I3_MEDTR|nr:psbP-like protein 1, chloroplastic isoform X2 [Medicago truncatula]AFK35875.1 unknown [Medicago truncatula]KEH21889.1 oxygen-evolving complex/thylakoid lumenal 25.6 kDa protein [Medicago truncatula]
MASLQTSPTLHRTLFQNSFPQKHGSSSSSSSTFRRREGISFIVKAEQELSSSSTGRRQAIAIAATAPLVFLFNQSSISFAADNKSGFQPVVDRKDGYQFVYPFGWQEVVIEGQDKVFKDVIEPLENVSVTMIPTSKQDIKEFGSPEQVAATLIKKVLAPPNQKTKIIQATEREIDGKAYYQFEFVAQAPNYTRHALSAVSIGNGKFYTLTTGANERRWGKMKDRLNTIVESFQLFKV